MHKKKLKTVKARDCSNIAMTCGNENKFDTVIHDGVRKHWVGIGWVDEGPATDDDYKKFPTVKG